VLQLLLVDWHLTSATPLRVKSQRSKTFMKPPPQSRVSIFYNGHPLAERCLLLQTLTLRYEGLNTGRRS